MNGATCVPVEPNSYSCQCPENLSGEHCNEAYLQGSKYLIIDEREMWDDAKTSCSDLGYNLTSITLQEEIDFLTGFVG